MEIGSVIKELRKKKKISQKELAAKCGISVNALSQIELNVAFPQKGTIKTLCSGLEITPTYLLFLSLDDGDIPSEKKLVFNTLRNAMKEIMVPDQ